MSLILMTGYRGLLQPQQLLGVLMFEDRDLGLGGIHISGQKQELFVSRGHRDFKEIAVIS